MRCPNCGGMNQTCFDSRLSPSGRIRKRSRKCRDCGYIFHTLETVIAENQTDQSQTKAESQKGAAK